ncbi:S41 family peptidase [Corynebacterium nasicanis]|uniref:S41 family peptidase n=1 Tax=Corynebacterium nasicanis TaxID=1448267 RepID=A0ABW1QD96_9CORY
MRTLTRALAIVAVIVVAVAWFLGPTLGLALRGQPFFLVPPSPERYAAVVLDQAERAGIQASSPEFPGARAHAEEVAAEAETIPDIHESLDAALVAAGGKHSGLITPEDAAELAEKHSVLPSVERRGGVLTATVPPFDSSNSAQAYADALAQGLTSEDNVCGIDVDLRDNTGGDMGPMVAGLSPLLPDGEVLRFVANDYSRAVTLDGNSVQGGGTAVTTTGGKMGRPVTVLVNGMTGSSGEATFLAFRGLENSRSFGSPTAGFATANTTFRMPDGAVVMLTVAHMQDRTGATHGDDLIHPDDPAEDPQAAALDWLATAHGCSTS